MNTMQDWLDAYGESHQNPTNKAIHWICVPTIFFSILGLLASIPHDFIASAVPTALAPYAHFGTIFVLFGILFFVRLSLVMTLGMLFISFVFLFLQTKLAALSFAPLWASNLTLFVIAWIGQFYGHKVEGAKPSFFDDLKFLLIGPAWLMSFIFNRVGIKY